MWYLWKSIEEFSLWHNSVKEYLGLPKPGVNTESQIVDKSAQWTENYTLPIQYGDNVIALVDNEIAANCFQNLGSVIVPEFTSSLTVGE